MADLHSDRLDLASAQDFAVEVCNTCGGLVGWEQWRGGCCLGGIVCKRESGTRFVPVAPDEEEAR